MDSIWTEESGKIAAIFCGLVINLIFNLIANRNILSSNVNKIAYFSIWILSGLFFISISFFSRVAEQLSLLFYGGIGLSVPQVGLRLMTINDLKKEVKDLEDSLKNFNTVLYIKDIPEAVEDRNKFGCNCVIKKALQKQQNYKQMGMFDSEKKAEAYLAGIKTATGCYSNSDKLPSQVDQL